MGTSCLAGPGQGGTSVPVLLEYMSAFLLTELCLRVRMSSVTESTGAD